MMIWKSDLYRFGRNKLLYGIATLTCLLAIGLTMLIRQDIRLGISVFGNLTAFKGMADIVRIGVQYQKGLGLLIAVLISVFIGQEYLWKTWQNKWIAGKSRISIYLSKLLLSSSISAAIFLLFEIVVLLCSGQMKEMFSVNFVSIIVCGSFIYAAIGAVLCMISMLLKNSLASTLVCLGYILFSETLASLTLNIFGISSVTAKIGEWIISHSLYGMSLKTSGMVMPENIFPIFANAAVIIILSTAIGILFFRKYEL